MEGRAVDVKLQNMDGATACYCDAEIEDGGLM